MTGVCSAANSMSRSHNIYVAVVDDDESVCRSLSRLLRAVVISADPLAFVVAFQADTKHRRLIVWCSASNSEGCPGWRLIMSQRSLIVMSLVAVLAVALGTVLVRAERARKLKERAVNQNAMTAAVV